MAEPLHAHWLRLHYMNPVKRWLKYLSPRHMAILGIESAIFKPGNYRRIIAISKLCRQQLMHYYGVPEDAIRTIYNGVDLQQFSTADHGRIRCAGRARFSIPEQDPVLLFAGNDYKRKGLQFALQYALALRGRGHTPWLLVAGRGNPAPYMRMARQKSFADRLVFLGSLPDMREAYHCADLLVHPALYEPFGNVCLEAMACGLPVATSRLTGAADIIDSGASGIVADRPWDIEAIVTDISAALDHNRAGLKDMAVRAAQRAGEFPLERNVQESVALYRAILFEKGLPQ
jgi:UDP-glucose:(heptosyl)LPS alpha-1,3-glucosyltransferase